MTDAADVFQAELSVLRDAVMKGIREDNVSDVQEGFLLYRELVMTVLADFRAYEIAFGTQGAGLLNAYGREMAWLDSDIRSFVEAAVGRPQTEVYSETLGFISRLAADCLRTRERYAFGSAIAKFRVLWHRARSTLAYDVWKRVRAYLLLLFEELGNYAIGSELREARDPAEAEALLPFVVRYLAELSELMKMSVQDGDLEDLEATLQTLAEALDFTLSELDRQRRRRLEGDSIEDLADEIRRAINASVLAVEGWALLLFDQHRLTGEVATQILSLADRHLDAELLWDAFVWARDERHGDEFEWRWWETSLWEGRRSGTLSFERYLDIAVVRLLLSPTGFVRLLAGRARGSRHTYERLRALLDELVNPEGRWWGLLGDVEQYIDPLRESFDSVIAEDRAREDEALIDQHLDEDRVQAFASAVFKAWNDGTALRHLVKEVPHGQVSDEEPLGESTEGATGDATPLPTFGLNTLVPKEFFTETEVHADPGRLGETFGRQVVRGEDNLIASTVAERIRVTPVALDEAVDVIGLAVDDLRKRVQDGTIVVFNSWRLADKISGGGRRASVDRGAEVGLFKEWPVVLRYAETDLDCVAGDFSAIRFSFEPMTRLSPEARLSPDDRLLVSLQPLSREAAEEIVDADENVDDQREQHDRDARVRETMTRLHARIFERIRVEVSIDAPLVGFRLTDD